MTMPDIQNGKPKHPIGIDMVGIKGLRYPIRLLDREKGHQETVAMVSMFVDLPHLYRGTHMSRFVEVLNRYRGDITYREIKPILDDIRRTFDARSAHLSMEFPYFVERPAPATAVRSLLGIEASFEARLSEEKFIFILGVKVPVTLLCPCSKEISERGAHNQRAYIGIRIFSGQSLVWLEELVELAEAVASAPVRSLLKRRDEKVVTEQAYDNPRFVEDVVRELSVRLSDDERIKWFEADVESLESIHNHNAYAKIERGVFE